MRVQRREIHIIPEVEFERGSIKAGENGFHTLFIRSMPDYDYCNWTISDLKDLRDALTWFIDHVNDEPTMLSVEKP